MLMAQAAPIKFGEMRNVFKCKYVHSAQKKKKKRVKCIHERRRMREGGNPRHSCEQRRNEAAVVRSGGWFAKLCFWTGFSSPSPAQIKRGLIIQVYGFHISLCLSLILPDFTRSARLQIHPRPNHQTADPDI